MEAYEKNECIGQGQFSRVFAGVHKSSRTRVALKLVPKPPATQATSADFVSLATLKDEVKCQRALRHPNILRLLACFDTPTEVVFVSELCSGDLLQHLKKRGKFSEVEVFTVAQELVSGLHYLHESKFIHRDLKLQNILVGLDGKHKICDFGFTRKWGESDITMQSVKGTPVYMSPEMIKEEPYTYRVDLWALGIILYELFYGLPPFYTTNIFNLVNLILNEKVKWPANISSDFKDFLNGLLDKNPKTRLCWPYILKHPYMQAGNNDGFEGFKDVAKSPTRIDSAVDVLRVEDIKEVAKIIPRSASIKDLILQDGSDWRAIQTRLTSGKTSMFSDQEMMGVLVLKMIAIGPSDESFAHVTECAVLFLKALATTQQESPLNDAYKQKALKQICLWMFTLAKQSISQDGEEFSSTFGRFCQSLQFLAKNATSPMVDWIPTSYAQAILPTVSKMLKDDLHVTHATHYFQLYVDIILGFKQSDFSVFVRDIIDLELVKDLVSCARNDESCLEKLLEMTASVFKMTSGYSLPLEQFESQLTSGLDIIVESKSQYLIKLALQSDLTLEIVLELVKRSDVCALRLFKDKSFLQRLFSVSASDQLDAPLRSLAITSICHIFQLFQGSTSDAEWLHSRMESLLSSLDPAKSTTLRSSPSKASFVFKSFSSTAPEKNDPVAASLIMLRHCLGKPVDGTDSDSAVLKLLGKIKLDREESISSNIEFYSEDIFKCSDQMHVRMLAVLGICESIMRNPKLLVESALTPDFGAMSDLLDDLFDNSIKIQTIGTFIRRFSGVDSLIDAFVQSVASACYIASQTVKPIMHQKVALSIITWVKYVRAESSVALVFGLITSIVRDDASFMDSFVEHAKIHATSHRELIAAVSNAKDKRVHVALAAFKQTLLHTNYIQF